MLNPFLLGSASFLAFYIVIGVAANWRAAHLIAQNGNRKRATAAGTGGMRIAAAAYAAASCERMAASDAGERGRSSCWPSTTRLRGGGLTDCSEGASIAGAGADAGAASVSPASARA